MNTEPIIAGGLEWTVEESPQVRTRGLRASVASATVEAIIDIDENGEDGVVVMFSDGGFAECRFKAAIWIAALDAARQLIDRLLPVRGTDKTPNP